MSIPKMAIVLSGVSLIGLLAAGTAAPAEGGADDAEGLAKKLSNPIAALISIPFQYNYDTDIGPDEDGDRSRLNIQPVIPISLNSDWNVSSRTILPVIYQDEVFPGAGNQFGFGDVVQSFFFSPVKPTAGGWIWGIGPVLLLPTGSDELLGADQWGVGPTGVVLKQQGHWTYGMLGNHIWGVAGSSRLDHIDATFIQPFVSFTTPTAWTFALNTESTYDWQAEEWSVPINATVSKLVRFGKQPVSLGGGLRYWADSPEGAGPENWGLRLSVTLLLPK